jgi:hypothetical protein
MGFSIRSPSEIITATGANNSMAKKNPHGGPQNRKTNGARKAPSKSGDPKHQQYTAIHETGHAVAAVDVGMNLKKVVIEQCPTTGVSVGFTDLGHFTASDLVRKGTEVAMPSLIQCFAGVLAEMKENPAATETFAFAQDQQDAYHAAIAAICELSDMGNGMMVATPLELRQKTACLDALWHAAEEQARKLLAEHWQAVLEVAELLRQKKTLSGKNVAAIVNSA